MPARTANASILRLSLLLMAGMLGYVMWLLGDPYIAVYVLIGVLVLAAEVALFLALIWVVVSVLARVLPAGWKAPLVERRRQVVLVAATTLFFLYRVGLPVNHHWLPTRYSLVSLAGNAVLLLGAFFMAKALLKLRRDRVIPYAFAALAMVLLAWGVRASSSQPSAVAPAQRTTEITQALATLPYIAFVPESGKHAVAGVSYLDPARAFPGFNLCSSLVEPRAFLLDMKGNVVHEWSKDIDLGHPWEFVSLCRNGDLLVSIQDRKLARLDETSRVKWVRKIRCHHDLTEAPNGDIFALERSYGFTTVHGLPTPARDDRVIVLSENGDIKSEFSIGELLRDQVPVSRALEIWRWQLTNVRTSVQLRMRSTFMFDKGFMDLLHTNTVTVIDHTYNDVLKEGNVIVCCPMIDLVAVIDPYQKRVVWHWGQGTLQGPHNARALANGHILVFDNGVHRGYSRVLELDPVNKKIVWNYEDEHRERFFSPVCGGSQRLPNGNTMITDTVGGRVFEVTPDGELVWEFYTPLPGDEHLSTSRPTIYRMERVTNYASFPWLKGISPVPAQAGVDRRRGSG
jgi:hypothetical protein